MGSFSDLFDAGDALARALRQRLALPADVVVVGPIREEITSSTEHVRITLLWVTQQPGHVNDGPERGPDGREHDPPLTLTGTYLITTYGNTTPDEIQMDAHRLLGDVLCSLRDEPQIKSDGRDATASNEITVVAVPLTLETVEKIFSSFQMRHRPFALCEIAPIRLKSRRDPKLGAPLVRPGGVHLGGPEVRARPVITRVVPLAASAQARIRVDGIFSRAPTRVWIGGRKFEGAALVQDPTTASIAVKLTELQTGELALGSQRIVVAIDDLLSDPVDFELVEPSTPGLDGPEVLQHDPSSDLVLTGRNLGASVAAYAWPDAGIRAPVDVRELALQEVSASAITIARDELSALRGTYRFSVRSRDGGFLPFIVLELRAA